MEKYAYETMLKKDNLIENYIQHVKRLKRSLKLLKLDCKLDFEKLYKDLLELENCVVRVQTDGDKIQLSSRKYEYDNKKSFILDIDRKIKKINNIDNIIKGKIGEIYKKRLKEAKQNGFDECLLINNLNQITEGCVTNIFFIKGNEIHTPALESEILAGITRANLLDEFKKTKYKVIERFILYDEIESFEGAFVSNSIMKIMPIEKIKNIKFDIMKTLEVIAEIKI